MMFVAVGRRDQPVLAGDCRTWIFMQLSSVLLNLSFDISVLTQVEFETWGKTRNAAWML